MNYLQQFRQQYSEYNDLSDQEVLDGLYRNHYSDMERSDFDARMAAEVPVPDDEGEIDLGTAFGAGVDILQQGLYSAAEGVGETLDVDFIKEFGREGVERQKEELAKATGLQQFREIGGVGDTVEFAGEQIAQQLPIMAPMLAGALGGAKLGATVGTGIAPGVGTTVGGFLGGVAGGALAGIPLFFGQNRERQKEVSGSVQSEGAAFLTAIPQATLDSALGAITLGLGRVGGPALNRALDTGGGVLTRAAKGFGFGVATEIPTEIGQQMLERKQAGLEVFTEEAMPEYIDAGAAALFVGGAFGTAGNVTFGNRQTLAEMRAEADDTALQQDLETLLAANNLKVDDLTDQEIVEFAEQEREKDPLFDYILSSGLADATKAKVLRRRMSEIFTGVLSEQQVANPVDEGAEPLRIGQDTLLQIEFQPGREETVVAREGDRPVTLLLNDEETLRVAEGYRTRFPEIDEILKSDFDNNLIKMRALRRALAELIPGQQAVGAGTAEIRAGDFSTELQEERGGIAPGAEGAPRLADRTGQPAERGALLQQEQADQAIAEDILARGEQEREDAQRRTTETLEAASATVSPPSELTDQQFEAQQTLEAAGRVLRGEQASTLGPEAMATVEGERANVPTFRAVQDARERVNGLLGRLESIGSAGQEAARAVRERIEQRNLTGDQALGMLRAAEAFAETLPVDAKNVELRFLDKVMLGAAAAEASGGGATAQEGAGRRLRTGNGLDGIIEISLSQPSSIIRSTAAHEAFHVMQDVYADVDPGAANILNRAFGRPAETKRLKDLPSGVIRMLKKAELVPGRSFWSELTAKESAEGAPIQSGELQAYTYQAYSLLKNQGKKVPGLGGAMSRYMIFNKKFFERLANSLRGDGFRTATEVFAEVPQTAQRRGDVQPTTRLREERVTPRQPAVTTPREEAAPVVLPEELADLDTQTALIETPQTVAETQDQDAPGSMLSFADVLMGDITPAEFQQSQQAIGLQMSGTGQLSRDTGREFARADFWGVPLEDGGFQIFPGIAQRQNVAMHLSGDGDVGRQAYDGLYDIRQTPDNQFKVIAPSRAEVDQQGNISITEKGKVALPDWSMVSTPEESEFEQASMLDRLARRATGVDTVQDGNVTRRFGVQDLPNLVRQRRIEGEPTFQLENLFADTETSEQASTLALSMQRLDQRIPQADRVASPNPRAPLTANSFTSILGGNGGGFNGNQNDINRIFEESIAETDDDGGTTARDAVAAVKMRPPNAAFWDRAFKQPNRVRYWYEASAEAFRDLTNFRTPEALARFIDIVSGTSGGVEPYPNLMRAMGVASEDAQGIPIRTDLRDPASATKALAPSDMETLKFGNFAGTMQFINGLTPKAPLSTNDTQVASAFGFPGTALASKPILYEVLSRFYQKLRDVQNAGLAAGEQPYESWQVQALGWVEERGRKKETKQNVSDDYGEALPKIISTLQANGVPVPGGQITETTLQDPRVPNLMSGTRRYFDQGRFATVETASELTPEGKRAAEIYEYLRGREEIPWVRDAKKKYIRQQRIPMEKLARRKRTGDKKTADPSLLSNIMSELVGTKVDVSRVDPRNFTGWGTFESVMSPNLRIPMQFRVDNSKYQSFVSLTPAARRAFLAMLGKALGQKAMAASQFTPAADPANPDTFRVFVQTTDPANFNPTVIETFERDAGGFPLNIEEVPNGYTIDLNVGGFDTGPNLQTVQDAVSKNLGNQDATIVPMDYASDYIEENGYVDANGDFQTVNGYDSFINELLEQDDASQSRDDTRGVGRGNRLKTRSLRDNLTRYAAQLEEISAARDDGFREWSDGVEGLLAKERRKEDERRAKQARIRTKDTLTAASAARKQMRTTGEQASVLGFPSIPINTPEFKNWFKDSKIVDADGNPLVLYHGTERDFDTFDFQAKPLTLGGQSLRDALERMGVETEFFYLTNDPLIANSYADIDFGAETGVVTPGGNVMPVYASIQNPAILDGSGTNFIGIENQLKVAIASGNYDGVVIQNFNDHARSSVYGRPSTTVIAFEPTQIKSVFNQGTFDPKDARIQASALSINTPAFKNWFKRSKVVDSQGNPLVVYHGSRADIENFDPTFAEGNQGEFGQAGMYFTEDPDYAQTYAMFASVTQGNRGRAAAGQTIYPVYLSIQNPLVIKNPTFWESIKQRIRDRNKSPAQRQLDGTSETALITKARRDELEAQGYDGIINERANEIIAFRPTQIKSVFNQGTFDPQDARIQASALGYNPIFAAGAQTRPIQSLLSRVIPTSFKEFRRQMINGFDPIADLEMRVNSGKLRDATQSAFKMAELSLQLTGRTESFLLNGPPVFDPNTGAVNADTTIGGLKSIFEPIGSGEKYFRFQDYAYARRAEELINDPNTKPEVKQNLEESFPAELRQQALALGNPEFDQVLARYKAFNDAMLQYLVDTGLISEAQREGMARTSLYVPFYKLADEDAKDMNPDVLGPQLRSGLSNPDAGIKALTGEGGQIGDLYENVIRNAQTFLGAGLRNEAMRRSVDLMAEAEIGGAQREKGPTTVTYKVGGQDRHYNISKPNAAGQIDQDAPALFSALTSFSRPQTQGITRVMETISNVFRAGITISPGFMVANFIRGDLAGAVTADAGLRPMVDSAIGLKAALTNNQSVQDLKQLSGVGGYAFGGRSKGFANQLKRDFRKGEEVVGVTTKITDVLANLWNRAEAVGEATELATREAIFRRLKEAGFNDLEAAYQGQALINYGRRGNPDSLAATALGQLIPLVPFLNARVQGLYRTASALSGKEATAKATILKGMALTAASMALYAASSGDERWKEEPLERRLNYYILYLGDKKILIPKPFEIGAIFSTLPEFITDFVLGNIRGKDAGRAALMTLTNTFAFNPVPQSVLPIIEVATNYDAFTGRPIETAGVQRLPSGDRAYSTTSQTAIQFGRLTGLSPLKFEQLVNGYLGSMGSLGLAAVDSVLSLTGAIPARPAGIFENEFGDAASFLSGLSRFVKESPDPANRFVGEFYELKREVDEIYAAVQDRRKNGEIEAALDLMKENRKKLGMRTSLNRMQTTFTDLNREIRRVKRSDDLTPDQKKNRLNRLINQRNRIAGQTEKILERID